MQQRLKFIDGNSTVTLNLFAINGAFCIQEGVFSAFYEQLENKQNTSWYQEYYCINMENRAETKLQDDGDQLADAAQLYTWRRDEAVKLRLEPTGHASEKPQTIVSVLKEVARKSPQQTALAEKVNGTWVKYSYSDYYSHVIKTAKAFIKLGLDELDSVGIIGFNSPEWMFSFLGSIFAGGLAVGIYTTNSPEACHYVADNARCNIIVVENDQQLQKILQVRDRLPHLKAIVQYKGQVKHKYPSVYSWSEMIALGSDEEDTQLEIILEQRISKQAPNKCCALIYTSGTTGNSKGVMLSHDNMIWSGKMLARMVKAEYATEIILSYLPLSHVAAQVLDIYAAVSYAATVYFAQPDALKGSLGISLKEVRPTHFLGVPRVWEKMQEAISAAGKQNGILKRRIATWAKSIGLESSLAVMNGASRPLSFHLANSLVFNKVRAALGLDRCRTFACGAAPLSRSTLEFFLSLNIPLVEVYGMSESSGIQTSGRSWSLQIGSTGQSFPGVKTIIRNPNKCGNGEIAMEGRHVFMGYLNMEEKTREVFDEQDRLLSGDIGRIDEYGFVYITGRLKELLITAGGENIPPVHIENNIKKALPCISNCMLIGDRRKFLSMLLTMKTEVDDETQQPLDKLSPAAVDWCRCHGSTAQTVIDVRSDVTLHEAIQKAINAVNKSATSHAQYIQKWSILPRDFSVHGGELGPTLKLKRSVVEHMYRETIDRFYSPSS